MNHLFFDKMFQNQPYKRAAGIVYVRPLLAEWLAGMVEGPLRQPYTHATNAGEEFVIAVPNALSGTIAFAMKALFPQARIICVEFFEAQVPQLNKDFEVVDLQQDIENYTVEYMNTKLQNKIKTKKIACIVSNYPYQVPVGNGKFVNIYPEFHRQSLQIADTVAAVFPFTWVKSPKGELKTFRATLLDNKCSLMYEMTPLEIKQYFPEITINALGFVLHSPDAHDTVNYTKGDTSLTLDVDELKQTGQFISNEEKALLHKLRQHPLLSHHVAHKSGGGSRYRLTGNCNENDVPIPTNGSWDRRSETDKRIIVKIHSPSKIRSKNYPQSNIIDESLVYIWDNIDSDLGWFDRPKVIFPELASQGTLGNARFIDRDEFACGQYCQSAAVANAFQGEQYLKYTKDPIFWFFYSQYRNKTSINTSGLNACPFPDLNVEWDDVRQQLESDLTPKEKTMLGIANEV